MFAFSPNEVEAHREELADFVLEVGVPTATAQLEVDYSRTQMGYAIGRKLKEHKAAPSGDVISLTMVAPTLAKALVDVVQSSTPAKDLNLAQLFGHDHHELMTRYYQHLEIHRRNYEDWLRRWEEADAREAAFDEIEGGKSGDDEAGAGGYHSKPEAYWRKTSGRSAAREMDVKDHGVNRSKRSKTPRRSSRALPAFGS